MEVNCLSKDIDRTLEPTALNFSHDKAGKLLDLETFLLSVIHPKIWTTAEKKKSLRYLERERDENSLGGQRHLRLNCRAN